MNELDALLDQILGRSLEKLSPEHDSNSWRKLVEAGLTRVGTPEDRGGSGGTLREAAVIATRASKAGVRSPLADYLFPIAYLDEMSGRRQLDPNRAASVLTGLIDTSAPDLRIRGKCHRVPWASESDELLVLASTTGGRSVLVEINNSDVSIARNFNLAGESRDEVSIDVVVDRERITALTTGAEREFFLYGAFGRSCQILGALRATFEMTVKYVGIRKQFSKPLSANQVVRHLIADMVCELSASSAAVAAATASLPQSISQLSVDASMAIAVAKIQTSKSATRIARNAHQLHGAIGLSEEYPLHRFTTQLWSWRDEYGSARYWSLVVTELARELSPSDLWSTLTRLNGNYQ